MITLEYFNGIEWIEVGTWYSELSAWLSLGDDNDNYRILDEKGNVLTDRSIKEK